MNLAKILRLKALTWLVLTGGGLVAERGLPASGLLTIAELAVPTPNSTPAGIASAADGSVWFGEMTANKIAQMTPAGAFTEHMVPTAGSAPQWITISPDGFVWFTERYGRKIGRISETGGPIAEFAMPGTGAFPTALATDAAGRVWFATADSAATARIGWISAAGAITGLATGATRTTITGIASGPDGNLWVTEVSPYWGDGIARVNTAGWGTFTNYKLPNRSASPQGITKGSDGSLWFTESGTDRIGRITTAGVLVEFALPAGSRPEQIVSGPDGNLWFTETGSNRIGRMSVQGQFAALAVPTAGSQPLGLTADPDRQLFFTEQSGNRIGVVSGF